MRNRLPQLGGQLGVAFCVVGLAFVFLGWNGAASWDRVQSQFPYLISGGVAGLCLVVIGAALMVVQSQRADRARIEARLDELREAIERTGHGAPAATPDGARFVVAGPTTFHRPDCRVLEGRSSLPSVTVDQAMSRGLTACRTCDPLGAQPAPARATRTRPRARRR